MKLADLFYSVPQCSVSTDAKRYCGVTSGNISLTGRLLGRCLGGGKGRWPPQRKADYVTATKPEVFPLSSPTPVVLSFLSLVLSPSFFSVFFLFFSAPSVLPPFLKKSFYTFISFIPFVFCPSSLNHLLSTPSLLPCFFLSSLLLVFLLPLCPHPL